MSKYTRFGGMLSSMAESGLMPSVMFTDNADMRGSLSRIADLASTKDVMEPKNVLGAVEAFGRVTGDRLNNARYSDILRKVASVFSKRLNTGIARLHSIKNKVGMLIEAMNENIERKYSEDPILAAVTNTDRPMKMHKVSWEVFNVVDERSIRVNVHNSFGHDINAPITKTRMAMAINKMPYANSYNKLELKKIELSGAKYERICEEIHKKLPKISASRAHGIFRNILDIDELTMRNMVSSATMFMEGKTAEQINKYMTLACEYIQVIDMLTPTVLDFSNSTLEEYQKHADVFVQYAETMLYIASWYRNDHWKDSVLVPGPYVNPDTYKAFEDNGGTISAIVRHKNHFFDKNPIPVKGVTGAFILQSAENLKNTISEEVAKNVKDVEERKRNAERDSFIYVSTEFLSRNVKKLDPKFALKGDPSKYAAAIYDSTANLPIESRFYRMIMNSCHINDLVSNIYNRLEKSYVETAATLGKITPEDKLKIETKVYADLVSEYMVEKGILIV